MDPTLASNPLLNFQHPRVQQFSLPECIVHYLAKNPLSSEGYLRLSKTCKYFFPKNPIILIRKLENSKLANTWKAFARLGSEEYMNLNFLESHHFRIWLTGELNICNQLPKQAINLLLQQVYRCDVNSLYLDKHDLSWTEFEAITASGKVTHLALKEMVIKNGDGNVMPFERILEKVPNMSYCA